MRRKGLRDCIRSKGCNMGIKSKIDKTFEFKVEPIDHRTDKLMAENMRHYRVTIKNKVSKKRASFQYSEGYGINTPLAQKGYSLVSSIYADKDYTSMDDMDGLGYEPQEGQRILKAIDKQREKSDALGLTDFFNSLSEKEEEEIRDGL